MQTSADTRLTDKPLHIALLGAAGTGKTRLAADLRTALTAHDDAVSGLVISDGPALLSILQNQDIAAQDRQACATILLMGLDLPAQGCIHPAQAAADLDLRQTLSLAGLPFSVIYGLGSARLHNALDALRATTPGALPETGASDRQRPWVWACDTCSDPSCEHRLLSALLAERGEKKS